MDEESAFGRDENGTDKVTKTNNDNLNEDDDSSDNDSVSSYDILPPEDFDNNEHGANSENVSAVYFFLFSKLQSMAWLTIYLCEQIYRKMWLLTMCNIIGRNHLQITGARLVVRCCTSINSMI